MQAALVCQVLRRVAITIARLICGGASGVESGETSDQRFERHTSEVCTHDDQNKFFGIGLVDKDVVRHVPLRGCLVSRVNNPCVGVRLLRDEGGGKYDFLYNGAHEDFVFFAIR